MLILAIDTATTDLVTGLVDVGGGQPVVIAESVTPTRAHNEELVPTVTTLLAGAGVGFADLAGLVVGCGPGPFTGLRVGMATASAFGQALGIPVHGVCTHDAVAQNVSAGSALIVTDARRREVYWAQYAAAPSRQRVAGPDVGAPAVLPSEPVDVLSVPDHLRDKLPHTLLAGAGDVTYIAPRAQGLVAAALASGELQAGGAGTTGTSQPGAPAPLVPLYLRRPDAKEPAPKPPSPAIPRVYPDQPEEA